MSQVQIIKKITDNCLMLQIIGRLVSTSAQQLDDEVMQIPENVTETILDLGQMEYTSSAGLRSILSIHKMMIGRNGCLKLQGVNQEVKKLLDMTGFTQFLNFI